MPPKKTKVLEPVPGENKSTRPKRAAAKNAVIESPEIKIKKRVKNTKKTKTIITPNVEDPSDLATKTKATKSEEIGESSKKPNAEKQTTKVPVKVKAKAKKVKGKESSESSKKLELSEIAVKEIGKESKGKLKITKTKEIEKSSGLHQVEKQKIEESVKKVNAILIEKQNTEKRELAKSKQYGESSKKHKKEESVEEAPRALAQSNTLKKKIKNWIASVKTNTIKTDILPEDVQKPGPSKIPKKRLGAVDKNSEPTVKKKKEQALPAVSTKPVVEKGVRGAAVVDKEPVEKKPKKKTLDLDSDKPKLKSDVPANKTESDFTAISYDCDKRTINDKPWNLKISSWNVDGLRAWIKKQGHLYIESENPDILCLQEVRCPDSKLPAEIKDIPGYHPYWLCGEKDGYAGVGILSKKMPQNVTYGLNDEHFDSEGRIITAEYAAFYLVCVYVPNAGRGLVTLPKRLQWNDVFRKHLNRLNEMKPVILCGDLNVAHQEVDLKNPKTNKKNAGFTQEERDGMTDLLSDGFVDMFRHLYPEEQAFTFWTYMMNCRAKDIGWRLDYFILSERLVTNVCDTVIRKTILGSDHCPITLFLHIGGLPSRNLVDNIYEFASATELKENAAINETVDPIVVGDFVAATNTEAA